MFKHIAIAASLAVAGLAAHAQSGTRYQATWLEYSKGWSSVVADFDGDGHDDVFNTGHDRDDRIWYATPTGYIPGPMVQPYVDRHACVAADVDHDGLLDLYCTIGADKGTGTKLNELWIQTAGGSFTLATNTGVEDPYGRGRHVTFFDLDHDGWPDLYVENEPTARSDGNPNYNHVFLNRHDGTFVEQPTLATGPLGFQCARKGDVDGDGWDDLAVCGVAQGSHLFVNDRHGNFTELSTPATAVAWNDARLVDIDGDGRDDLVLVNTQNVFQVWLNSGSGTFFDAPSFSYALPGVGVSLAVGDFDHDGHQDVYVVLQDAKCQTSLVDLAPDIVFWGQPGGRFTAQAQPQGNLVGCGHLADTVDGDKVLLEQEYYSVGGGFIEWKGYEPPNKGAPKYPYSTMKELQAHAEKNNLSVAQVVMANEVAVSGKSEAEINAFVDKIHNAMVNIVKAGLKAPVATLPGPIKLKTKAGAVYKRAMDDKYEKQRGVGVVAAAVYNSGLLSTDIVDRGAHFDYGTAPAEVVERAVRIGEVCARHGVSLPAAAVQYPLRHPAVVSVVTGMRTADHVESTVERYRADIPEALWDELDATGLAPDQARAARRR